MIKELTKIQKEKLSEYRDTWLDCVSRFHADLQYGKKNNKWGFMIDKLSKKQEEKLSEYRDKWLGIGLDTKRANRSVAEKAAKRAYKQVGLAEPKHFIWVD